MYLKNLLQRVSIFTLFVSILSYSLLSLPEKVTAAVSDWQKGASIEPFGGPAADYQGEDFKQSLRDLRVLGANYVTLVIPQYQSSTSSADIGSGWNTPTDETLIEAIDFAHSIGLSVMLKPHLNVEAGDWRANIDASDRSAWFQNYGDMIRHYATLGEEHGVAELSIGAELITMATETSHADNTERWEELIASVRPLFSGKLTYSANWGGDFFTNEKDHIEFWDKLDYIGISAYFNLTHGDSVADLRSAWD